MEAAAMLDPPSSLTVQFSQASCSALDGQGDSIIMVTLSAASSDTVTVQYSDSPGTAQPNLEYTPTSGTATFMPGQTSSSFTVPILDDEESGQPNPATVNLSLSGHAAVAVVQAAHHQFRHYLTLPGRAASRPARARGW
jgi:hypothetical protein